MTLIQLAKVAAVSSLFATQVSANTVDFDFAFDGITGTIFGLDNADGSTSAQDIFVSGIRGTYNLGNAGFSFAGTQNVNQFSFLGGQLVAASVKFEFVDANNSSSLLENFELNLSNGSSFENDLPSLESRGGGVVFTQVSTVPLPAGGILLVSSMLGLIGLKRRHGRTI